MSKLSVSVVAATQQKYVRILVLVSMHEFSLVYSFDLDMSYIDAAIFDQAQAPGALRFCVHWKMQIYDTCQLERFFKNIQ